MITTVIPIYNEGEVVLEIIEELSIKLKSIVGDNYQIILVDDGSSEQTKSILSRIVNERVSLLVNVTNMGYGYSLKRGISNSTYDDILIIDADGTYPIDKIDKLYKKYKEGFDLVVASRGKDFTEDSFVKSIFRNILRWIVEFVTGNGIPDINSGMRLFSSKTISPYFNYMSNRFSFTTSMTLLYSLDHKLINFYENGYLPRQGKSKVKLGRDILRTLQIIFEITAYKNPVKLHLLFLCLSALISLVLAIVSFVFKNSNFLDYLVYFMGILMIQFSLLAYAAQGKDRV